MKIKVDRKNSSAIIYLPEKSLQESAIILGKEIKSLLSSDIRIITFDMGKTLMIDSSTLGVLIHLRREFPASEVEMIILNARGYVKGLLENSRFTSLFKMVETAEAA